MIKSALMKQELFCLMIKSFIMIKREPHLLFALWFCKNGLVCFDQKVNLVNLLQQRSWII